MGGAAFFRQLLIKYKGDSALALAAYNAGPGAVDKYKGVPPYLETHRYILKVLQEYGRQQRLTKSLQQRPQSRLPKTDPRFGSSGKIKMQIESALFFESIEQIYERVFRNILPRTPVPSIAVRFRQYANANSRIGFRKGNYRLTSAIF